MKLINLTPHEITLCGKKISASGTLARVAMTRKQVGQLDIDGTIVPIYSTILGAVTGLPDAVDGVSYFVSGQVRSELPERRDLYSPADLVRDSAGIVIGCNSLDASH
jgi:hypothetical protein